MADIFVSYSQEDRPRVEPIVRGLETMNWSVWWDVRGRVGADLDEMVKKELAEAKCVLVAWSNSSIVSGWVKDEAGKGKKRKILVPVLLDEVEPPFGFGSLNMASLVAWTGDVDAHEFQRVIEGVKFHVWSGVTDAHSLQAKGYEIAIDRMDQGADLGAGKYFSILNPSDPISALESDFEWTMGSNDYGLIKYYYLYISHPHVANSKNLKIIRVHDLESLKKNYPDNWKVRVEHLQPLLVLDYSYFQLLEDKDAAVGGMLYRSGSEPIEFYAPFAEWSARLGRLLE